MKFCFLLFAFFLSSTASSYSQWSLSGNSSTNPPTDFIGTTDNKVLVFKTSNTIRMRIGSNASSLTTGSVTIGDIDPDASAYGGTLQLKGNNLATTLDLVKAPNSGSGWDNQIRFFNTNNLRHVIVDDFTTGKLTIQTNVDVNGGGSSTLRLVGKMQIGDVPTPTGYSLWVEHGILTERVKVALKSTSDWGDFVFEENYKMLTIEQLKSYISKQKHLPNVPSAEDLVKSGIDLGEMQAIQIRKIEELTLYIIQLNDKITYLETELKSVKDKK